MVYAQEASSIPYTYTAVTPPVILSFNLPSDSHTEPNPDNLWVYIVKRIDGKVRHSHRLSQDQFIMVAEKVFNKCETRTSSNMTYRTSKFINRAGMREKLNISF
jgi:hypothetical protein